MAYIMLDLETTGLDPQDDYILEVAWTIVDKLEDFDPANQVFSYLIDQKVLGDLPFGKRFKRIDPVVQKMHTESGLRAALVAKGTPKWRLNIVDAAVADELGEHEGPHYLVGNSIRLDRAFIETHMPLTAASLHYRQLDVTALRLMFEGLGIEIEPTVDPSLVGHRAADDVRASIHQLLDYRDWLKDAVRAFDLAEVHGL